MAVQTANSSKSRSAMELAPYNNWQNRLIAATMMNKMNPATIGGFLLGNFLKPIVGEGLSRLSDNLMSQLFPTKKSETTSGEGNINSWKDVATNYPAFDSGKNVLPYAKYTTPAPYAEEINYFNPSSKWDELTRKFSVQ